MSEIKKPEMTRDEITEIESAVGIARLMIKSYEETGGGYSQKEALKILIKYSQLNALDKVDERKLAKILDDKEITVFCKDYLEAKITGKSAKEIAHEIAKRWKECVKLRSQRHS